MLAWCVGVWVWVFLHAHNFPLHRIITIFLLILLSDSSGVTATTTNFQEKSLQAHNEWREKHGTPPLVLNQKMCEYSQKWAQTLADRDTGKIVITHSNSRDHGYGENIAAAGHKLYANESVKIWHDEIKNYHFGSNFDSGLKTAAFTQLVWKSSKELGVGRAVARSGNVYVVANYFPGGNIEGQYITNVVPLVIKPHKKPDPNHRLKDFHVKESKSLLKFQEESLKAHNEYRKNHGSPPLVLSQQICEYSQKWAQTLADRDSGKLELSHSNSRHYGLGENIAGSTHRLCANESVKMWYNEIQNYHFGTTNSITLKTGAFTQVVWKSSQELGVGRAVARSGNVYVVANYSPKGNIEGLFETNVFAFGTKSHWDQDRNERIEDLNPKESESLLKYQEDSLKAHNKYREKHGSPPLILNQKICDYSQKWAQSLADRDSGNLVLLHSQSRKYGYGEIVSGDSHEMSAKESVKWWYDDIRNYHFGRNSSFSLETGAFTQVIWKSSKELGIGRAVAKSGNVYVVANYFPCGNVKGQFFTNVLPLGFKPAINEKSTMPDPERNFKNHQTSELDLSENERSNQNFQDSSDKISHETSILGYDNPNFSDGNVESDQDHPKISIDNQQPSVVHSEFYFENHGNSQAVEVSNSQENLDSSANLESSLVNHGISNVDEVSDPDILNSSEEDPKPSIVDIETSLIDQQNLETLEVLGQDERNSYLVDQELSVANLDSSLTEEENSEETNDSNSFVVDMETSVDGENSNIDNSSDLDDLDSVDEVKTYEVDLEQSVDQENTEVIEESGPDHHSSVGGLESSLTEINKFSSEIHENSEGENAADLDSSREESQSSVVKIDFSSVDQEDSESNEASGSGDHPDSFKEIDASSLDQENSQLQIQEEQQKFQTNVLPLGTNNKLPSNTDFHDDDLELDFQFQEESLDAHNEYREKHGAPPLILSKKISRYSQEWAQTLADRDSGYIVLSYSKSENEGYGENIAGFISHVSAKECVKLWYNEIQNYHFAANSSFSWKTGAFTQLVWKSSKEIGVGRAVAKSGNVYVVVNYSPKGNIEGKFQTNVLPLGTKLQPTTDFHEDDLVSDLQFQEESLDAHNEYREKHGAPPLILSKKISRYSQEWAQTLADRDSGYIVLSYSQSENEDYGENIAGFRSHISARECIKLWYNEIHNYHFAANSSFSWKTGAFTQLVWKSSKEIGVGRAVAKSGNVYVVVNYSPKGNIKGKFQINVLPLRTKPLPIAESVDNEQKLDMKFQKESLRFHNKYRKKHGAPPLVLSQEICKYSQKWAQTLADRDSGEIRLSFSKPRNLGYGENIAGSSDALSAEESVEIWYEEIEFYHFGHNASFSEQTAGFTQLVWKSSKELGVGRAVSKSGNVYIVANYSPRGNVPGKFLENVLPSAISDEDEEFFLQFRKESLQAHNKYREIHGAPPLVLNEKICQYSQMLAETLADEDNGEILLSPRECQNCVLRKDLGENFAAGSMDQLSAKETIKLWYEQVKFYRFGIQTAFSWKTAAFTQLVWKSSKELGVGWAVARSGNVYVVANYFPRGNVAEQFLDNVLPSFSQISEYLYIRE